MLSIVLIKSKDIYGLYFFSSSNEEVCTNYRNRDSGDDNNNH